MALKVSAGDIRFENVSFAYGATGPTATNVIDHLSLHIRPGEKIGLVGRSGAGKSTLLKLVVGAVDHRVDRVVAGGPEQRGGEQHPGLARHEAAAGGVDHRHRPGERGAEHELRQMGEALHERVDRGQRRADEGQRHHP